MSVDVLRVCAVLQDCADQLAVLGNIIRPGADTVSNIIKLKTTSYCNYVVIYFVIC